MLWEQFIVILTVVALGRIEQGAAGHHAHSFAHFYGPVEGPGHEVVTHDKHGHHNVDYVAHPKYEFAYGVEDHHTGDYHSQKEHRNGNNCFKGCITKYLCSLQYEIVLDYVFVTITKIFIKLFNFCLCQWLIFSINFSFNRFFFFLR